MGKKLTIGLTEDGVANAEEIMPGAAINADLCAKSNQKYARSISPIRLGANGENLL